MVTDWFNQNVPLEDVQYLARLSRDGAYFVLDKAVNIDPGAITNWMKEWKQTMRMLRRCRTGPHECYGPLLFRQDSR